MILPPSPHDGELIVDGGLGERASLKAKRRRRAAHPPDADALRGLPTAWRDRLSRWLSQAGPRRRIESLLRGADGPTVADIAQLIRTLLDTGWIEVQEQHQRGSWCLRELHWRDADALREALGLGRLDAQQAAREQIAAQQFSSEQAQMLHSALLEGSASLWLRRVDLIAAVDHWQQQQRSGSRRDFELLARGETKSLSEAEWAWLQQHCDLDVLGIAQHAPGLWLRAPWRLQFERGSMDLQVSEQPLALTPDALLAVRAIDSDARCWRVIENRTSFERTAQRHPNDVVVWVPGMPPSWWQRCITHLLTLAPAPLQIACDPDPAGILIAEQVAALWRERQLHWQPWGMGPSDLDALPSRRPLNERDRQLLSSLGSRELHPTLQALRRHMLETGCKGEQEGLI